VHTIAAKAVCFKEAMEPSFIRVSEAGGSNAKALANAISRHGFRVVSGGTDNHVFLIEVHPRASPAATRKSARPRGHYRPIKMPSPSIPCRP